MYAAFKSSMSTRCLYTFLRLNPIPRKQNEVLCKRLKAKKAILHTILLGVGGSIYTSHTTCHLKELGLDKQKSHKSALKVHAHSVLYAHKLKTTSCDIIHCRQCFITFRRRALEKSSCSLGLGLEQWAACHPPDPH